MPANWPELTLALALVLVAAYVVSDLVARWLASVLKSVAGVHERLLVDRPRRIVRVLIFLLTATGLAVPVLRIVGVGDDTDTLAVPTQWLLGAGLRLALIVVAAYMVVRIGSAAARRFEREMAIGTGLDAIERAKRAQTLGRVLQKSLTVVVAVIAGLMGLRELGVDITPALTGAGIVGLAVGFGAQTLVRDIISGFFLILEDQVRVGDVAVVNGQGGLVEALNLRTIVLRDLEGAVHVIPNGEVKTLTNRSKDFSYAVLTVNVDYGDDVDRVADTLVAAAATLTADGTFKPDILEPLEILGVDDFDRGQLVLRARIKTMPLRQWVVGRELRKRVAQELKARGLQLGVPEMRVRLARPEELDPR